MELWSRCRTVTSPLHRVETWQWHHHRATRHDRAYECEQTEYHDQKPEHGKLQMRRSDIVKTAMLSGLGLLTTSSGVVPPSVAMSPAAPTVSSMMLDEIGIGNVMLSTLQDCSLAVSIYPTFSYDAAGGGGIGRIVSKDGDIATVEFDASSLNIPAIDYKSTKVLGIPIPPPLCIRILPKALKGTVNMKTGEANLDFDASFQFDAGNLYHAAPLSVVTTLSTEGSSGKLLQGPGARLNGEGKARLAGVASVPKTGDLFLDGFLLLPSEALAVLSAELRF